MIYQNIYILEANHRANNWRKGNYINDDTLTKQSSLIEDFDFKYSI